MIVYRKTDIALTEDGDILFTNGDFSKVYGSDAFLQHIKMYVLTKNGELPLHYNIGTMLDELEGMPNTPETGYLGKEMITNSLSSEGIFNMEDIEIVPVPTNYNEITFYIKAEVENYANLNVVLYDVPVIL